MDDRDLLQMAAKAVGIEGRCVKGFEHLGLCTSQPPLHEWWNPLEDDGDALRLAIKARIALKFADNAPPEMNLPRRCAIAIFEDGKFMAESVMHDDEAGSMRMVLVRAAAEIGKNIP